MSAFLQRFIEEKKWLVLSIIIVFCNGLIFGFLIYSYTNQNIQSFFQSLFYLQDARIENHYHLYLIQNCLFILISTYLSTSYIGHIGMMFLVFVKGLQIAFSLIFISSYFPLSFLTLFLIAMEVILEMIFVFAVSAMSLYLSSYVCLVTFYLSQTFHIKNMINYRLNHIIVSLVLLCISLAFRLYFIPLF